MAAQLRAFCYIVITENSTLDPLECLWSQALAKLPDARISAPKFGASDCRSGCCAHLVAFPAQPGEHLLLIKRNILALAAQVSHETLRCQYRVDDLSSPIPEVKWYPA